jgi:hypothetical protein
MSPSLEWFITSTINHSRRRIGHGDVCLGRHNAWNPSSPEHRDHGPSCRAQHQPLALTSGATYESDEIDEILENQNDLALSDASSCRHPLRRLVHVHAPSPFASSVFLRALRQFPLHVVVDAFPLSPRESPPPFRFVQIVSSENLCRRLSLPHMRGAYGDGPLCGGHDHDGHLPGHLHARKLSYQTPSHFCKGEIVSSI